MFPLGLPPFLRAVLNPLLDPFSRYRHAKLIHATRVALGALVSIVVTQAFGLPHGEWATITLLVVIAGLQHHGNIRRKAFERAFGTIIGCACGLLLLVEQAQVGHIWLTWLLMAAACGVCAYYAIGKGGYIALLSAITLVVVAGHGGDGNTLADGLWRTADVLIGIAIALLFSFALPLYATWSWRYKLADILTEFGATYARMIETPHPAAEVNVQSIARLRAGVVQLRSLMSSVASEVAMPIGSLEAIQRHLQVCISTLDLLPGMRPADSAPDDTPARLLPSDHTQGIRDALTGMARALKYGADGSLDGHAMPADATDVPASWKGHALLTRQLRGHVEELRQQLSDGARYWQMSNFQNRP